MADAGFPIAGCPPEKWAQKPIILVIFSLENCMKLKKIGPRGGRPGAPPNTDQPMRTVENGNTA